MLTVSEKPVFLIQDDEEAEPVEETISPEKLVP